MESWLAKPSGPLHQDDFLLHLFNILCQAGSLTETEHLQAPFGVIFLEAFRSNDLIKNAQLKSWLMLKLRVIRQLKCRLKMILQAECFRESSCKHCKTAMLVEKNLADFLAC